jgi:pilus assembly protein CpaB
VPRFRRPRSPVHLLRRVLAGLLAGFALVLALRPAPAAPAPAADVPVAVAARDLAAGAVLSADDLTVVALPPAVVPDGVVGEVAALAGDVLAGPVRAGEPVTDVRVVGPGLWSQVPPGQVAAPVRLADLAVAGLLRPGDRVDVLATTAHGSTAEGSTTEVVAADALVLTAPPSGPSATGSAGTGPSTIGSTAAGADTGLLVLAVPSETAARLAASATSSTLTVTLGPP